MSNQFQFAFGGLTTAGTVPTAVEIADMEKAEQAFAMKSMQGTLSIFEKKLVPLKDASTYANWLKAFQDVAMAKLLWINHLAPTGHKDAGVVPDTIRASTAFQLRDAEAWLLLKTHCTANAVQRFANKTSSPRIAMDLLAAAFHKDSIAEQTFHQKKLLLLSSRYETLAEYVTRWEECSEGLIHSGGTLEPTMELSIFEGNLPPHLQDFAAAQSGQPHTSTKDSLLVALETEVTKRKAYKGSEFMVGSKLMQRPPSGRHSSSATSTAHEDALWAGGQGGGESGFNRFRNHVCYGCGKKGHIKSECRSTKKKEEESADVAETDAPAATERKAPSNKSRKKEAGLIAIVVEEEDKASCGYDSDSSSSAGPPSFVSSDSDDDGADDDRPTDWDLWTEEELDEGFDAYITTAHLANEGNQSFKAIVDSGSTRHLVGKDTKAHLHEYREFDVGKHIAIMTSSNDAKIFAVGEGTLHILSNLGEPVNFKKVLYVPDLSHNLLSVKASVAKGCNVRFNGKKCEFTSNKNPTTVLLTAALTGSQYMVFGTHTGNRTGAAEEMAGLSEVNPTQSWHERLGHIAAKQLLRLQQLDLISGVTSAAANNLICDPCSTGKAHKLAYASSDTERPTSVNCLISFDISGPYKTSTGGKHYVLGFIDHFDDDVTTYFLRSKSEAEAHIKQFVQRCKTQHETPVKVLRSDNAREFATTTLVDFYAASGIKHEVTSPYSSLSNGKIERFFRTLFDAVRTGLARSGLPSNRWAEAANHFVYTRRRTYVPILHSSLSPNSKTIYELREGKIPSLKRLHAFGSVCTVLNEGGMETSKTLLKGSTGVLLGYSEDAKAFRLLVLPSGKVYVRRHVTFTPTIRYYCDLVAAARERRDKHATLPLGCGTSSSDDNDRDSSNSSGNGSSSDGDDSSSNNEESTDDDEDDQQGGAPSPPTSGSDKDEPTQEAWQEVKSNRRSSRTPAPRLYGHAMVQSKLSTPTAIAPTVVEAPKTLAEAVECPLWRTSILKELSAILKNHTWVTCELPPGRKAIKAKFIFKNKMTAEHTLASRKTRLVLLGYRQVEGIDYFSTYSGVVKTSALFAVLAQAADEGRYVICMDVNTAFLESDMQAGEHIYMEMPPVYEWLEANPDATDFPVEAMQIKNRVVLLKKSLYGLKQAPRNWNRCINQFFVDYGLKPLQSDPAVYNMVTKSGTLTVALYVDDMAISCTNKEMLQQFRGALSKRFSMTDLGDIKYMLGMEITRDLTAGTLSISQKSYIESALAKFQLSDANPVTSPMEVGLPGTTLPADAKDCDEDYRAIIGTLLYLSTHTRPDIAFAVGYLSRFMSAPKQVHYSAAKRVLKYLKKTIEYKITFGGKNPVLNAPAVVGYVDADWAGDASDRKSTSGYVFMLYGGAISWRSRKQNMVSLSSCESEYVSLAEACKEMLWLKSLYGELGILSSGETFSLLIDNAAAKFIAESEVVHDRSKHIDIRYHFIKDLVNSKAVILEHVGSSDNISDLLTKPLPTATLRSMVDMLGLAPSQQ